MDGGVDHCVGKNYRGKRDYCIENGRMGCWGQEYRQGDHLEAYGCVQVRGDGDPD